MPGIRFEAELVWQNRTSLRRHPVAGQRSLSNNRFSAVILFYDVCDVGTKNTNLGLCLTEVQTKERPIQKGPHHYFLTIVCARSGPTLIKDIGTPTSFSM